MDEGGDTKYLQEGQDPIKGPPHQLLADVKEGQSLLPFTSASIWCDSPLILLIIIVIDNIIY